MSCPPSQDFKDNLSSAPAPLPQPQSSCICPGPVPSPVYCWAGKKADKLPLQNVIPPLRENLQRPSSFQPKGGAGDGENLGSGSNPIW